MSSVLQKLITPVAGATAEPPRNKVTVVGVGQVGMACAVSILLRVRLLSIQWREAAGVGANLSRLAASGPVR